MTLDKQLFINLISVFLLLVFIFFLLHKGRKKRSNYMLALFFFSQVMGILGAIPVMYHQYFIIHYPSLIWFGLPFSLLWAPSLYLYVSVVCGSFRKINPVNLLHFLPYLAFLLYFSVNYHFYPVDQKAERLYHIFNQGIVSWLNPLIDIQVIVYNFLSLWTLYKFRSKLMQQVSSTSQLNIRWLSLLVYGYLVACFTDDILIRHLHTMIPVEVNVLSALIFFFFFIVLFYKGFTSQEVFLDQLSDERYKSSTLTSHSAVRILTKLDRHMASERPFLRPDLTIKELAAALCVKDRQLSQVINEYKQQHFYDYINSLRIAEAARILTNPGNELNILQVMYEVGFNSKTAFNKAFKKHMGITPTAYKKSRKEFPDFISDFELA